MEAETLRHLEGVQVDAKDKRPEYIGEIGRTGIILGLMFQYIGLTSCLLTYMPLASSLKQ